MNIGKTTAMASLACGLVFGGIADLRAEEDDQKSSFDKFYGGVTIGSDKTSFDFDGSSVTDKAISYGVIAGKNVVIKDRLLLGAEAGVQFHNNMAGGPATPPLPVTFTTAAAEKTRSFSFNAKAGFVFKRVAVYGLVGVTNSRLKFSVDGTPVGTFFGRGTSTTGMWGLTLGAGIEVAIPKTIIHVKGEWRRTRYAEVSAEDFGLTDADFGLNDLNSHNVSSEFRGALIIPF